jgi:hypothetical protein
MAPRRAAQHLGTAACRVAPAVIPFVLAVILLAPATLGGKVLSASDIPLFSAPFPAPPPNTAPKNPLQFDAANVFEPDGLAVRAALRNGRLPVWQPALTAGRPLLAEQQSAPLYPLTWIGVVFPYWESLAWIAVFKLTLAALGTVLLARALGLGLGPALLAGIAFGFGSYLVDWLMHPHANAYVALPWLFLFTDRLCRTGAATDAAALGATLGVAYLGGQPESALIVSLATAGWLVARLAAARPHRAELARTMVLAGGAVVLGLAIAAVMLLPFIEALRESSNPSRSGPPMPAKAALSIFFPEYWPTTSGPSNFTERTLNVGVLPTMLAAAASWPAAPAGRSGTSPRSRWLPWPSPSTPARCPTSRTICPASTRSTSPASSCWPRSGSPCSRRSGASDSSPERRRSAGACSSRLRSWAWCRRSSASACIPRGSPTSRSPSSGC